MLIKCTKNFRNQISTGRIYLVIEVIIGCNNSVRYRIIDDDGCPAIYNSDSFEIISNSVSGFGLRMGEMSTVLSHKLILDSSLNAEHMEGFWGLFFDDDPQAAELLEDVIASLAAQEGV